MPRGAQETDTGVPTKRYLQIFGGLGLAGAILAYALGGWTGLESFVEVLVPATVVFNLLLFVWEYKRKN